MSRLERCPSFIGTCSVLLKYFWGNFGKKCLKNFGHVTPGGQFAQLFSVKAIPFFRNFANVPMSLLSFKLASHTCSHLKVLRQTTCSVFIGWPIVFFCCKGYESALDRPNTLATVVFITQFGR